MPSKQTLRSSPDAELKLILQLTSKEISRRENELRSQESFITTVFYGSLATVIALSQVLLAIALLLRYTPEISSYLALGIMAFIGISYIGIFLAVYTMHKKNKPLEELINSLYADYHAISDEQLRRIKNQK